MKTNRLAFTFARTSFIGIACLTMGMPTPNSACASPVLPQQQNETPDPYFSGDLIPSTNSLSGKPASPTADQSTLTHPEPWTPPTTPVNPEKVAITPQPSVTWDAPLTKVVIANLSQRPNPAIDSNGFDPQKKSPGSFNSQMPDPASEKSIIREGISGESKDWDSNTFGIQAPKNNSPIVGVNDAFMGAGPSERVSGNPVTNDFQSDNSFSAKQPSRPEANALNQISTLGSPDSFDSKPSEPGDMRVAQTSFNSEASATSVGTSKRKTSVPTSFEAGKILALVGSEPIFVGDLMFDINQMIERFMPGAPEDIKERERQKMIPQLLPRFVESKILFLGTLRMLPEGVDVDKVLEQASQEFDEKALDKMIKGSGLKTSTEFDANLRAMGSSLRQLRKSWGQDQLTKYFLSQQLKVKAEVTHQEMLDSYHENIAAYEMPAKCRWEQVMIRFDRSSSRDAAKASIVELGNQIVYGANLAAVARKSSHGFLASDGGKHDWTTQGALVLKEIDEAIFSLPVGELSDIIESRDGYHVIRVIERTEATRKPFLEAQVEIKQRIEAEKRQQAFDKHVEKLKSEIPVEYFLNDDAAKSIEAATSNTSIH